MDLLGQQNADNCMIGFIPLNEKDRKFCQHSLEWNPDKDFQTCCATIANQSSRLRQNLDQTATKQKGKKKSKS